MIELLTADTPNGKKISIMLEEIKFDYKITKINIFKDEQFRPEFKKLSPFSKIPVIIDNKVSLFESGAILIYLGEKSGKFYDKKKVKDPDNLHLHQLIFTYLNKKIKKNKFSNTLTGIFINIFNFSAIFIGKSYVYSSYKILVILIFLVTSYLTIYFLLRRFYNNIST